MPLNGYPPFCNAIACLAYALCGGFSAKAAIISQLVFLLPIGYGVFYIGRRLGGLWGGVLALLSVSGNLWLHLYARGYFLEVGESAALVCILATFIACEGFRRLKPSLLFGVCLGIGMLIKWAVLFYLAPLFVYAAVKVFFFDKGSASPDSAPSEPSAKRIFLYSLGAAVLICGWWYAAAFFELLCKTQRDTGQSYSCFKDGFTALLVSLANGWWLAFLWLSIGCFISFKSDRRESAFIICASLAVIASAVFVYPILGLRGVPRYVLPGSVLMSALAFAPFGNLSGRYLKTAVLLFILTVNSLQLNITNFYRGIPLSEAVVYKCNTSIASLEKFDYNKNRRDAEIKDFVDTILAAVVSELRKSGECRFTSVSVRGRHSSLDPDMFILRALEVYNFPIDVDIYVPVYFEFEPTASLLLFLSAEDEIFLKDKHFQGYRKVGSWKNGYIQNYAGLYKNGGKHDSKAAMPSFAR